MAKQINKKTAVKKTAIKAAPVMEHKCGHDCPCGCHKHGTAHRIKHVVILLLVFILGYACGKMFWFGPMHRPMMPHMPHMQHPVFVNGCLDMQSIKSQKLQEVLITADVNGDSCVSEEEYKAFKAAKAQKFGKKGKHGFMHGKMHQKPQPQQQD